jgi:aminopeptidase
MDDLETLKKRYAELIARMGINLQPEQCVLISAEIIVRDFVVLLVEACYAAGAKYVQVQWGEPKTGHVRLSQAAESSLDYVPAFEVQRFEQMAEERWARIALTSEEFPDIMSDVDAGRIRKASSARSRALKTYVNAQMSNQFQWCVVAVPTPNWAAKIYPDQPVDTAVSKLWAVVLKMVRADAPDPVAAWRAHDLRLKQIAAYLAKHEVRAVHFLDTALATDGRPATDLRVGLTDAPLWVGGSGKSQTGIDFMANMPTEEVFCTPHRMKAEGWVRTSKTIFPLAREVRGAYFRFEQGICIEASADFGGEVLQQFLEIPGARQLGEVALVDVRSPVNETGLVFFDGLFDENAACHIAFGKAYTECVAGADAMSPEEQLAFGLNESDAHDDFMIGTPTMRVTGTTRDGREVAILRDGQFVAEIFA